MVQEGVTTNSRPQPLKFPGLSAERTYKVREVTPAGTPRYWQIVSTPWTVDAVTLSGKALAEVGIVAPILTSEQATLFEITAIEA
jgi:alpha-galactosidase